MFFHAMVRRGPVLVLWLGLLAALLCSSEAAALCDQDESASTKAWHPSIKDEFAASKYVVEGAVLREEPVFLPSDHRLVITHYTVRVLHTYKGKPASNIVLTAKNTVGQFSMTLGEKYLLFVQKELITGSRLGTRAHLYVYKCGNSSVLDAKSGAPQEVLTLSAQHHAHPKHAKHPHPRASAAPNA